LALGSIILGIYGTQTVAVLFEWEVDDIDRLCVLVTFALYTLSFLMWKWKTRSKKS
jgi:uncharacterized membrane protein YqjE